MPLIFPFLSFCPHPRGVLWISCDGDDQMEANIKTQNMWARAFSKTQTNPLTKIKPENPMQNFQALSSLVVLNSQNYMAGACPTEINPPKKVLAKIFLPPKILELKILNPKKSFDHPSYLKSGVPPWDPNTCAWLNFLAICYGFYYRSC